MSDDQEIEGTPYLGVTASGSSQLYRELRWKNSQLRKTCGKQGQTIHRLRAELAEVRELNSKIERGDLRRLERVVVEQAGHIASQTEIIKALEEKLAATEVGTGDEK